MPNLQSLLLGLMIAVTPSLIWLALALNRAQPIKIKIKKR
jgi:hypothetical protein